MKPNKNKKILIIGIIIVILIILVAGLVFAFVATDVFKSKKELFFKYASQVFEKQNGFIDQTILGYFDKQKTNPYQDNGSFDVEISDDSLGNKLEKVNDFNISFSGNVDIANSKSEQNININYSDEVGFPLIYKQVGNYLGIQTKYIGSKYVAINNNDMESLYTKLDIENTNTSNITSVDFFTQEELNTLFNNYSNILNEQLGNEKFTQIKSSNATGYKLTLQGQEIKNLIIKCLETAKTDDVIIQKLKQYTSLTDNFDERKIDSIISEFENNTQIEQNNIEITVYQSNDKLNQISIKINEALKIDITKTTGEDEIDYNLNVLGYENNMEVGNLYFNARYTGLQALNTVNENYELGFEVENSNILNNTDTANTNTEKEAIQLLVADVKSNQMLANNSNSTITDADIENALSSNTQEAYSSMKLQKIDDTTFSITFIDTNDKFVIDNKGDIVQEPEQEDNNSDNQEGSNRVKYRYIYNNIINFTNGVEIEDLNENNSMILNNQSSDYVNNLINAISTRLQQVNANHMEELGLQEDENPITYLIPGLRVYLESKEQMSNEIQNNLDQIEISAFNQKFEMYASTNSKGATAKGLLSTVLLNNQGDSTAKIEEINFDGQEYEVTEQNITLIKSNINVEDSYKVEFEKNQDTGLIYRIVINKV